MTGQNAVAVPPLTVPLREARWKIVARTANVQTAATGPVIIHIVLTDRVINSEPQVIIWGAPAA